MWSHFIDAYRKENYCRFRGVASRREFWSFVLIYYVLLFALLFVVGFFAGELGGLVMAVIFGLFTLVSMLPYLSLTVRRLHDTNRSGWWLVGIFAFQVICAGLGDSVSFLPFYLLSLAASIWLLVMLCQASRPSRYSIEIVSPEKTPSTEESSAPYQV